MATAAAQLRRMPHRLVRCARLLVLLAFCALLADGAAGAVRGEPARAAAARPAEPGAWSDRDALPLALAALAFVLVRGWRRDRSADNFG